MQIRHITRNDYTLELIGISTLLLTVLLEYVCILFLNDGKLVYTMDDPYIHLALAENIWNGHYGINAQEVSAPSSSIAWPFILAPLANYSYTPFILNVLFALATVVIYAKSLRLSFGLGNSVQKTIMTATITIALILATNLVGLIFIGMEHSLQVMLAALIAYGLMRITVSNAVPIWLSTCVILAPLVRYENLAISTIAIIYFFIRGFRKQSLQAAAIMVGLLVSFSAFLVSIGLSSLPTSIKAKSMLVNGGGISVIVQKIKHILLTPYCTQSRLLCIGAFILLVYASFTQQTPRRQLAIVSIIGIGLHLVVGQFGWYNRYEIYILAFSLLVIIFCCAPTIEKNLEKGLKQPAKVSVLSTMLGLFIGLPYLVAMISLPVASNNIYQQQYQLHLFATEFYDAPVAVNDIGYVSYQNPNYVLDLWGLASSSTLQRRLHGTNPHWLRDTVETHTIGLVMIYDEWFDTIPSHWIKLGELNLGRRKVTPDMSTVAFYSTLNRDGSDHMALEKKLNEFVQTLPSGVTFSFHNAQKGESTQNSFHK